MDDYTSELPCGKTIDDFIFKRNLPFHTADALIQYHEMLRTKKGLLYEEAEFMYFKDTSFLANKSGKTQEWVKNQIEQLHADSLTWNGK